MFFEQSLDNMQHSIQKTNSKPSKHTMKVLKSLKYCFISFESDLQLSK